MIEGRMTVKQLKEILSKYPDDAEVDMDGNYGYGATLSVQRQTFTTDMWDDIFRVGDRNAGWKKVWSPRVTIGKPSKE